MIHDSATRSTPPTILAAWCAVTLLLGACGDDSETGSGGGKSSSSATTSGGGSPPDAWIEQECGICFSGSCAAEVANCGANPGCGAYLDCLEACPAEPAGGPAEPACAAACVQAQDSAAQSAIDALELCRLEGAGVDACPTCGSRDQCASAPDATKCDICEDEYCCSPHAAYSANPESRAIYDCYAACDFGDCLPQCLDEHPDGVGDWAGRLACIFDSCAGPEACGDAPPDVCTQCTLDECGDAKLACGSDADCYRIETCIAACPGVCVEECLEEYPAGADLFNAAAACYAANCSDACG